MFFLLVPFSFSADSYLARHLTSRGGRRGGNGRTKAERSLPNRCRERWLRGQRAALAGEGG
jgi:hypothetical protein